MTYIGTSEMLGTVIGVLVAAIAANCRANPDHILSYMEAEGGFRLHDEPVTGRLILDSCDQARHFIGQGVE